MLSKCANPECSEIFRYLHQGKLFCLAPTPEVEDVTGEFLPQFQERFWLCDACSRKMTVIWGGTQARVVPLPIQETGVTPVQNNERRDWRSRRPHAQAASANREDR